MKTAATTIATLTFLALTAAAASPCYANEVSERLVSVSQVDVLAGNYDKALATLDRAAAADPADPGVRAAQSRVHFEMGNALVRSGKYVEGRTWLLRAQADPEIDGRASLMLAVAALRLGEYGQATKEAGRAGRADASLTVPATFYQGVAAWKNGSTDEATGYFRDVVAASPDSAMGQEAGRYLDLAEQAAESEPRRWSAGGELGLQYDSNPAFGPSNPIAQVLVGTRDKDDFRVSATADLDVAIVREENVRLAAGYELFQSLHFEDSSNDIQDHRFHVDTNLHAGILDYGLATRIDYYLNETDGFLTEGELGPWAIVSEEGFGHTDTFFRMRTRRFESSNDKLFDGQNYAAGVRQSFFLGDPTRSLWVGYRYDDEDIGVGTDRRFAYEGNQGEIGVRAALPWHVDANAYYAYRFKDYDDSSLGRDDKDQRWGMELSKRLSEHFWVTTLYEGRTNDSNHPLFDADRHIVSIAVEVR